jgi:hypothetical protein
MKLLQFQDNCMDIETHFEFDWSLVDQSNYNDDYDI